MFYLSCHPSIFMLRNAHSIDSTMHRTDAIAFVIVGSVALATFEVIFPKYYLYHIRKLFAKTVSTTNTPIELSDSFFYTHMLWNDAAPQNV